MEKLNLSYLSVNSARSYNFYIIPKELIDNPAFDDIDYGSKLLYGLMLNRASLSATNSNYIDDNGNVYVIYTVEQVMEGMRCSRPTAIKMLKQLDDIGLIEKKRLGQGKPSLLYVMDFSTVNTEFPTKKNEFHTKNSTVDFQKSKKLTSERKQNELSEVKNFDCSHINQTSHNNGSYTDSIDSAEIPEPTPNLNHADSYDSTESYNPKINHNPFNNLSPKYADRQREITEIKSLISEINMSRRTDIRVGKKDIPLYDVRSTLSRLTSRHIEYVLDNLEKKNIKGTEVKRQKPYLLTALYNAASNPLPVDPELIRQTVKGNINLDYLNLRYSDKGENAIITELFNIIVEVLVSTKKSFRLAKDEFYSDEVKRAFASLTSDHVIAVLDGIQTNTSEVKAAKAFAQTALWNSFHSLKIGTTMEMNHFLYENLGIEPK